MSEIVVHYEEQLHRLYQKQLAGEALNEEDKEELKGLIVNPKDPIDSISYVKVMYLYGMMYMQDDRKPAARYCAMRIRSILQLQEKKRMPRPRFLDFQMIEADDGLLRFMDERTAFLKDTYSFIQNRLIMLVVVFSVILAVGLWFFKISLPVITVVCVLFAILNYVMMFGKLKRKFDRRQTLALADKVDAELAEFDRPVLYS